MGEEISYPAGAVAHHRAQALERLPRGGCVEPGAGRPCDAGAFALTLEGNVPLGAGLSSSASIEVATALALLELAGTSLPLPTIALACQRAENVFVGARSGIMDQFIACAGKQDHALMLDCRSLEYLHSHSRSCAVDHLQFHGET